MSVLGYSKIIELLTGIRDYELENALILLSKHKFSELRYNCLKSLAIAERSTIPSLLKAIKENTSGGTYLSINSFFSGLERDNILIRELKGRRTYWKFSDTNDTLRKYFTLK
jgi:hypothetical protein